jgi:hypothetical protein|tara:strand:+ start:359 stop:544 length:186 start_codon:yes stop_codon:yes gene_type:complete
VPINLKPVTLLKSAKWCGKNQAKLAVDWGLSMEMPVMKSIPFCIEEGTFKNFVLSKKTIKY